MNELVVLQPSGQIGNRCPGRPNETHTFESGFCLNDCERVHGATCVPHAVLLHIQRKIRTDKHVGQYISVTSLLGCQRQTYLERAMPYYVEPPKNWYTVRGTLIHNILQNPGFGSIVQDLRGEVYRLFRQGVVSREELESRWVTLEAQLLDFSKLLPQPAIPDWESEVEYEFPLGIINGKYRYLRGTIDVLRRLMGKIIDFKSIGDNGLGMIKNGAKRDHVRQFNLYRFLVERGYPVGENYNTYKPAPIKEIAAYYMSMMAVVGTGSNLEDVTEYQKKDPDVHPNEISREVLDTRVDAVLKRGKRHETAQMEDFEPSIKNKWKLVYQVPHVPLEDLDEIEKFIHEKARVLIDAFDEAAMPDMCDPEMRAWKCDKFCAKEIRERCDQVNAEQGVERIAKPKHDNLTIPVEV